jgi:hypothetical protein
MPRPLTPPLRRDRLRELGARDQFEELTQARLETCEERLALALELSDLTRELAEAASSSWLANEPHDLAEKAHLYLDPLRAAAGVRRCR